MNDESRAIIRELYRLLEWLVPLADQPDILTAQCSCCPPPPTVYGTALLCWDVAERLPENNPARAVLIEWLRGVADYGLGKIECCPPQPVQLWELLKLPSKPKHNMSSTATIEELAYEVGLSPQTIKNRIKAAGGRLVHHSCGRLPGGRFDRAKFLDWWKSPANVAAPRMKPRVKRRLHY